MEVLTMGRDREPTPEEVARVQARNEILVHESLEGKDGIAYNYQIVDDEKILMFFQPHLGEKENGDPIENPYFMPLLLPLLPYVSRLCYLTSCSPLDADVFKCRADYQITLLKARAKTDEEYDVLEAFKAWIEIRINDSIGGSKLRALTESRRFVDIREEKVKRGLFRR